MRSILTGNLGYPRIGESREWKKALEAFWSGAIDEPELQRRMKELRLRHLKVQQDKGIDMIPVGDFTLYDQVLDTAAMFGIVPKRFAYAGGPVPLSVYFAMARGTQGAPACEMTKWFNTNYHYIVPELNGAAPALTENKPLLAYREAKAELGIEGKPVLIGLYTFLTLAKCPAGQLDDYIARLLPLYAQIVTELEREGVQWLQIDEPALVSSIGKDDMKRIALIYGKLHEAAPGLRMMLQTYFDALEHYEETVSLPVQGIGFDLVRGWERTMRQLAEHGFPENKTLGAGLIDGRNIWAADLKSKLVQLEGVAQYVAPERLIVQPSCSLLHVPVTVRRETKLDAGVREALAFADEKLDELVLLAKAADGERGESVSSRLEANAQAIRRLQTSPWRIKSGVREATMRIGQQQAERSAPFAERRQIQQRKWRLPFLPTTTIGSFPQTAEVRQARSRWRSGEWTDAHYEAFIQERIREWIGIQEQLGLDVLVHGEFERTDMVEYFSEKLGGFLFTQNGWVQSYGSRCVRPPIILGDVEFISPMTVKESVYAQSLTAKPVKGMLTGPVTILNWSFVRDDLPREQVAYQIALALRKEVEALEQAGIGMIQVDEPALREGLPIKRQDWAHDLDWAVRAFRLTTSTVAPETQIHTHMCYCEFHDIIDAIRALDADVISIETSRSHGELLHSFEEHTYDQGIGLGVYDIHSPRVPPVEEMVRIIERSLAVLDPELFWVNPDCGLKTRGTRETIASLRHMVEAAKLVREKPSEPSKP